MMARLREAEGVLLCWWEGKPVQSPWESVWTHLQNQTTEISFNPAVPLQVASCKSQKHLIHLEIIMFSEINQTHNLKYHMILLYEKLKNKIKDNSKWRQIFCKRGGSKRGRREEKGKRVEEDEKNNQELRLKRNYNACNNVLQMCSYGKLKFKKFSSDTLLPNCSKIIPALIFW